MNRLTRVPLPVSHYASIPHLLLAALLASPLSAAEPDPILLWPHGAAGSEGQTAPEKVETTKSGERNLTSIHQPSLVPYLPPQDKSKGVAIVIAPGGGHSKLCIDHEGHNLARWLADRGVAAFVLKYRLSREPNSPYRLEDHAVADMQRAIRLVRSRAADWHVDPHKVGALGFSAGGELAFLAAMREGQGDSASTDPIEAQSARPDFQCLIYPGKSGLIEITKGMPQAFLVCGYSDRQDIAEGLAEVYLKFKRAKVPAELHVYAAAGHGFGVRDSTPGATAKWPARLEEWLADRVLNASPPQ